MSAQERNTQVPALAPHVALGPGTNWRIFPSGPLQLTGDWLCLKPQERVPEVPVVKGEHLHQLEKMQEVLPSRGDEDHFL